MAARVATGKRYSRRKGTARPPLTLTHQEVKEGDPALAQALYFKEAAITAPLDWAGGSLRIVVDSQTELTMRSNSCAKEPETVAWLEREIKDGDVLYDVGACIGAYSLVAGALGAAVYAFEPSAHNHRQLVRNIALNDLREIRALPFGLGSKDALRYINLSSADTGAASHVVSDFALNALGQPFVQYRLDALLETFTLRRPTLLKIDVDGGELGVLLGAQRTLHDPALRSVQIEMDADHGEEVRDLMEVCGFYEADRHQRLGGALLWNVEFRRNS